MASSARIEELERKFTENPRRFFAPLANEFRKAGQLQEAIALCREFVPQQPGHMSGHIVLGQSLFEAGDYTEARAVFTTALELDPENLIALRHLGDIARLGADIPSARMWYQRVLEVDPRNEDTVTLLASVNAVVTPPLAAAGRTEGEVGGPVDAADGAAGWGGVNPEQPAVLSGEIHGEAIVPMASDARPRLVRVTPPAGGPDPVLDGIEQEEAPRAHTEPGYAFVTETMAQLYLQQGHRDEALKVYRQLLAQRPNDS
ncbi:MAG: tetratricopeptide repeat protein, partial [Candidatus Sulfotelmatobacter sp.]